MYSQHKGKPTGRPRALGSWQFRESREAWEKAGHPKQRSVLWQLINLDSKSYKEIRLF